MPLPMITREKHKKKNKKQQQQTKMLKLATILQHESIYDVFVVYLFVKL